jgi:hypothetical protein
MAHRRILQLMMGHNHKTVIVSPRNPRSANFYETLSLIAHAPDRGTPRSALDRAPAPGALHMQRLTTALILSLWSGMALASPNCTSEPKDKWLSETAMKSKIADLGYKFKIFKVTAGNCYEIYGQNKAGQRTEVYFHPITGEIVEEHKS